MLFEISQFHRAAHLRVTRTAFNVAVVLSQSARDVSGDAAIQAIIRTTQ